MLKVLNSIFNRVYHERKENNPDDVPSNNITPKFIERVEELLSEYASSEIIICLAGSNTSMLFRWNYSEYYVAFNYVGDKFEVKYNHV